jgi:hypothetical protein
MMINAARLKACYLFAAITWLSTALLMLLLIGCSYALIYVRDHSHPSSGLYSRQFDATAMHRMSSTQAKAFFEAFDRMGQVETYLYQPWVGFSERVYHSRLLNVDASDPLPTRRTVSQQDGASVPTKKVLWLFGGSTAFGWGVPDNETVASHLEGLLSKQNGAMAYKVVNHGHSFFYSSQETLLFQELLRRGQTCDIAVFLDGLNDSFYDPAAEDVPAFTARMAEAFAAQQTQNPTRRKDIIITPDFPPVRVLKWMIGPLALRGGHPLLTTKRTYDRFATYDFNVRSTAAVAGIAGVKAAFFWQPTPFDYIKGSIRDAVGEDQDARARTVRDMNVRVRARIKDPRVTFLADLFVSDSFEQIYVDPTHYGDEGCHRVAEAIAKVLERDGYLR